MPVNFIDSLTRSSAAETISYRQVGVEPTIPQVPRFTKRRARPWAGPPSIPGKYAVVLRSAAQRQAQSGFGGSTRRFTDALGREKRQVPGPGSYMSSRSAAASKAPPRGAAKAAMITTSTRFSNRRGQEESQLPGPGQYTGMHAPARGPETLAGMNRGFGVAERSQETVRAAVRAATRARRGPNRPLVDGWGEDGDRDAQSTPGPGAYGGAARRRKRGGAGGAASVFRSTSDRIMAMATAESPAPGRYDVASSVVKKRVNRLGSSSFLSSRTEAPSPTRGNPGPGSYAPINGAFARDQLVRDASLATAVATASAGAVLRERQSVRAHAASRSGRRKQAGAGGGGRRARQGRSLRPDLVRVPLSSMQAPRGGAGVSDGSGGMLWRNASSARGSASAEASSDIGGPRDDNVATGMTPAEFRTLGLAATSVYVERGVQRTVRPSSMFGLTRRDRFGRSLSGIAELEAVASAPGPAAYDSVDPTAQQRAEHAERSASWARSRTRRAPFPKDPNAGSPGPFETGAAKWIPKRSYLVGDGRWL